MGEVSRNSDAVTEAIRDLADRSERIGTIVEAITGLAQQTNLPALNAAIEAARAGEQGKGFAVVAEEVRKLAEESQTAAASISTLIEEIQQDTDRVVEVVEAGVRQTQEGVATVEHTREALERIGADVQDMHTRVTDITSAVEEISAATARMQADVGEVAAVAEQSSASTGRSRPPRSTRARPRRRLPRARRAWRRPRRSRRSSAASASRPDLGVHAAGAGDPRGPTTSRSLGRGGSLRGFSYAPTA
jgi:methyl-accepting chemotaxis protein